MKLKRFLNYFFAVRPGLPEETKVDFLLGTSEKLEEAVETAQGDPIKLKIRLVQFNTEHNTWTVWLDAAKEE